VIWVVLRCVCGVCGIFVIFVILMGNLSVLDILSVLGNLSVLTSIFMNWVQLHFLESVIHRIFCDIHR